MKWFRHRHAELDARVAEAEKRAEEAAGEARLSEARHEAVMEGIVKPMWRKGERNQFAQLIRQSIIEGHGRG